MKALTIFFRMITVAFLGGIFSFALGTPLAATVAVVMTLGILVDVAAASGTASSLTMKILWGAGIVDGRGKLGGWVAAKNRAGNYFRTKISPSNPQSDRQMFVRQLFTSLSQGWRSLTEDQRAAWRGLAEQLPYTDVFGNTRFVTGQNLYVGLNTNLVNAGFNAITNAPTPAEAAMIESLTLTAFVIDPVNDDDTFSVSATTGAADVSNQAMLVYATPAVSPSRLFTKNLYRFIRSTSADAGTTTTDAAGDYIQLYGRPAVGQAVDVAVQFMNVNTGQTGLRLTGRALVEQAP